MPRPYFIGIIPHMKSGFVAKSHTADCSFELYGQSPAEIFVQAARAIFHEMTESDPETFARGQQPTYEEVQLHARSLAWLLVDWLNEIIYRYETHGTYVVDAQVEELHVGDDEARLRAQLVCLPVNGRPAQLQFKAATYHDLRFERTPDGWVAEVVLDV